MSFAAMLSARPIPHRPPPGMIRTVVNLVDDEPDLAEPKRTRDDADAEVLDLLNASGAMTFAELEHEISADVGHHQLRKCLARLVGAGKVFCGLVKTGSDRRNKAYATSRAQLDARADAALENAPTVEATTARAIQHIGAQRGQRVSTKDLQAHLHINDHMLRKVARSLRDGRKVMWDATHRGLAFWSAV